MSQHTRVFLALILGAITGSLLHSEVQVPWLADLNTHFFQPVGQVFLRLIFMVVVPLVFSALVLGIYELGKGQGLGRVAGRTMMFTVIASSLSVFIGIALVNVLKPGLGFQIDPTVLSQNSGTVATIQQNASAAKPASQAFVELITKNPVDAALRALDGEMLSFMFFALFFGLGLVYSIPKDRDKDRDDVVIVTLLERMMGSCLKIVEFAMKIAPLAVFVIVFNTAFKFGYGVFASLIYYIVIVVVGLLLQQFVVYTSLLKIFTKISPRWFFSQCKEVYLYAFSTASSNATLPRSLAVAEEKLKLPPRISRFVLTVGATANQNGTALFEGVTVLFLAQVYGVQLDMAQQVQVVLMSILAGIGTAGVPGGSMPLIMILLQSVGIPAEGLGLVLGVDRILDMCRTTLNVSGDLVIAALVSHGQSEGESSC